ncbi:MAG: hypothetical protein JXR18_14135 [Neptuniibacter sp.]
MEIVLVLLLMDRIYSVIRDTAFMTYEKMTNSEEIPLSAQIVTFCVSLVIALYASISVVLWSSAYVGLL